MNRSLLASLGVMLLAMVAACGTSTAPPPSAPLQPELTSRPLGSAFAAVTGTGFPASSPAVVTGTTPQGTTTINVTTGSRPFSATSEWNLRVDKAPLAVNSAKLIAAIAPQIGLHADFGSGLWEGKPIGIPYVVVPEASVRVLTRPAVS